jgi:hypothetical protein
MVQQAWFVLSYTFTVTLINTQMLYEGYTQATSLRKPWVR